MYATFAYRYGTFSCGLCDVLPAGTQCGSILRCQAAHSVWVSHIVTAATWGRGLLEDRWVCDVHMICVSWATCVSHVSTLRTTRHLARIRDSVTSVHERDTVCERDTCCDRDMHMICVSWATCVSHVSTPRTTRHIYICTRERDTCWDRDMTMFGKQNTERGGRGRHRVTLLYLFCKLERALRVFV